jgi:hypothetical protein
VLVRHPSSEHGYGPLSRPILKGPVAVVAARPVVVVASGKAAVSVLPCPCPRFRVRWARTCALAAWRRGAVCR